MNRRSNATISLKLFLGENILSQISVDNCAHRVHAMSTLGKELDPPYRFGLQICYLRIPVPLISKVLKFTLSLAIGSNWNFRGPKTVSILKKDVIFYFFRELKKEISKFHFFGHEN